MPKYSRVFRVSLLLTPVLMVAPILGAQPTPPRARIVEDLRLDAIKEDLPSISGLSVGPQRQIAILIQADHQLRLYRANGTRIGVIGRKGSGPGEFIDFGAYTWKADTLVVDDFRQRRSTFISSDTKVLRTTLYPTIKTVQLATRKIDALNTQNQRVLAIAPDGAQLVHWNEPVTNPTPMQRAMGRPLYALRVTPDGTARFIFDASDYFDDRWAIEAFGFGDFAPFTFVPKTVASTTGDRLAHMTSIATSQDGGTFTVSVYRPTGALVFARTFPFLGVPIPKAARDSAIAEYSSSGEGGKAVSDRFQEQARQKMPAAYAGVENILLGLDDTVWITLRATAEVHPVLVLNGKGDPIATVLVPKNSRLRQASATNLWMTEKDNDGLVSVVRYTVSGVTCGSPGC